MSTESNTIPPEEQKQQESAAPIETQSAPEEPKPKSKEYNFRQMERKIKELEEQVRRTEMEKQKPSEGVDESDLLTVGQMKKILEEQMRNRELSTLEDRLQTKFPDYNQVVSEDAVEDLRHEHPELFNSLKANPDPYQKAVAAYKLLKSMKGPEKQKEAVAKVNQQKIEENRSKPQLAASTGSVLSQASGWVKPSKEQKAAAYQEMKSMAAKRG